MARSWEWDCEHGVGHPKPDAENQIHGCDGCCTTRADVTPPLVRSFDTGATRSQDADRDDPDGYMSPLAIDRFNEYMTKNRLQPDGSLRDSDNWQKGLPLRTYMKGGWRHFLHWWTRHRGWTVRDPKAGTNIEEDLCALFFNVQGYLHEVVKARLAAQAPQQLETHDDHSQHPI